MYSFSPENDLNAFEEFVLGNGGIYMQSSKWAQVKKEWSPYFFSGFNTKNERVLTALVLERRIPASGKLWYCPAGAVCDYGNAELVKEFSSFIKKEMKKHSVAAMFFDPCVELRRNGEKNTEGKAVHDTLISCGFSLNTDASKCLYKSPVQLITSLKKPDATEFSPDELLKSFEKGVRYSVRIGEGRGLCCESYTIDDVEKNPQIMRDFLDVMHDTSERDDFVERGGEYCTRLMKVFGPSQMDIMLVYYDREKDTALENERLARKAQLEKALPDAPEKKQRGIREEIDSINKQSEHFAQRVSETENSDGKICVAGGMTVHYGNMSSCLFGGAKNLLRNNLRSSHYFNFKRICKSLQLGNDYHDLGYVLLKKAPPMPDGTLGICEPNEDFEGIAAFKKSFGADYIEYIGEYVLVGNKLLYYSYTHLIEAAREVQSKVNRVVRAGRDKK